MLFRRKAFIYRNTLFRSKIEAQWAAFFDLIGRPYRYETTTYYLDGGAERYTPDFELLELDGQVHLVETKGDPLVPLGEVTTRLRTLSTRPGVSRATVLVGRYPGYVLKYPRRQISSYVDGRRDRDCLARLFHGEMPGCESEAEETLVDFARSSELWAAARKVNRLRFERSSEFPPRVSERVTEHTTEQPSWWGPFPWTWLTLAFSCAGKHGLLIGLYLWHAYNTGGRQYSLGPIKFDLPIDRADRQRAVRAMAAAGLLTVERRAGVAPSVTLVPTADDTLYIVSPIPIDWIHKAAELGRAATILGLASWRLAGKHNSATARLWRDQAMICPDLITDAARRSAQRKLADAGLISVKAMGGAPEITILPALVVKL